MFNLNTLSQRLSGVADLAVAQGVYRKLPGIAVVGLILLIAYLTAQITWMLLSPPQALVLAPAKASASGSARPAAANYAGQIAASQLFGKATKVAKSEAKPIDAPETRQNLKLRGIYSKDDEEQGYALISSGSGAEKLYRVGEMLPGNSKLSSVFPDRVMLERAGKFETLRMLQTKLTGGGVQINRSPSRSQGRKVSKKFKSNSDVGRLREEILKNPAKLTKFVNAVPARENGKFVGFKIVQKKSHPAFKELDLRSGDVVTAVNGIMIDSPQKGFQVLQKLRNAKQFDVTLKRGGQVMQLSHSIQ